MVRFLLAVLAMLALIVQSLAVQPLPGSKLPATADVGIPAIVSRAARRANGPRFNLQLRRG